jgi:hypothetical protein
MEHPERILNEVKPTIKYGKYQEMKTFIPYKLHLDKFDNLQKYNETLRWQKYKLNIII